MRKPITNIQADLGIKSLSLCRSHQSILIITLIFLITSLFFISSSFANTVQWRYKTTAGFVDSSPAVCDLDGDGELDLVMCTTAGRVFALDSKGKRKWFFDVGGTISSPPTILGVQKPKILVITNPGKITCLNGKSGSRLWEMAMPGEVDWGSTTIAVADINGDGRQQIIVADKGGHMICLEKNGSILN